MHLTPDPSSLRVGRQFVARTLRGWDVNESHLEPVTLVANELVANAIVHANSAPVLSLAANGSDLMVRVSDDSPNLPAFRSPMPEQTGGRGLMLVNALADRWGYDPRPSGKVVWAKFAGAFR